MITGAGSDVGRRRRGPHVVCPRGLAGAALPTAHHRHTQPWYVLLIAIQAFDTVVSIVVVTLLKVDTMFGDEESDFHNCINGNRERLF